jgi:hypothetical protein
MRKLLAITLLSLLTLLQVSGVCENLLHMETDADKKTVSEECVI